jgi:flagellar hook-length control protein FliK
LNLKSNEKQSNTEISNTSSKDAAILDKIAANNAQNTTETNKQLQNQLDNQKVADSKAAVNSVQNNGSQLQNNLSNNDSNGFRNSSESFAQTFSNNSAEAPAATGEFTKFQKYVDTISNNIKNMGTDKAAKAQDVLAQIKFGISSINSKASNKITIQLHPKELGSVDVRMDIGNDGKTKVAIMTEKIDTLNLLQKESGSLKGLLQDALQTQSSDLSFSFHEQSDEKWKEIIQEAFGDSNVQNNEEDEGINNMSDSSKYYSNNMLMTDGLDISV